MKSLFIVCLVAASLFATATPSHAAFDDYFVDKTMRIDYYHTGDAKMETVALDRTVTLAEAELMRAMADALDCPVPPLLPGQPLQLN